MRYVVLIHKHPGTDFSVSFPDVPGCVASGETLDAALKSAAEALAFRIDAIERDGQAIPKPSTYDEVISNQIMAEDLAGAVLASVPLVRDLGSTTRINVSLDYSLLRAIDGEARQRKQTRSAFIASAVRKEILES